MSFLAVFLWFIVPLLLAVVYDHYKVWAGAVPMAARTTLSSLLACVCLCVSGGGNDIIVQAVHAKRIVNSRVKRSKALLAAFHVMQVSTPAQPHTLQMLTETLCVACMAYQDNPSEGLDYTSFEAMVTRLGLGHNYQDTQYVLLAACKVLVWESTQTLTVQPTNKHTQPG